MTDITRGDYWAYPFARIPSLFEDIDDLMVTPSGQTSGLSVSEDDKNVYVEAAIPGIKPEDVDITVDRGVLWIRAQSKQEEKEKEKKYYRRATRAFSYRVAIPENADTRRQPEATCENGMVMVTFPKTQEALPQKITIRQGKPGAKEAKK